MRAPWGAIALLLACAAAGFILFAVQILCYLLALGVEGFN